MDKLEDITREKKIFTHYLLKVMTKNPVFVDKNEFAAKALTTMNNKKITSLIVHKKEKPSITIGVIHVHTVLQSNIS